MKNTLSLVTFVALMALNTGHAEDGSMDNGFVDMLVPAYLQIQQGLADDDLTAAQAGAVKLQSMLGGDKLPGDAKAIVDNMGMPVLSISRATDISSARQAFHELSKQVEALVRKAGTSGATNLYLVKCPMAFGGKGGTWIQDNQQVANPYYGSQMYRCGGVQEQIAGKTAGASPKAHNHAH